MGMQFSPIGQQNMFAVPQSAVPGEFSNNELFGLLGNITLENVGLGGQGGLAGSAGTGGLGLGGLNLGQSLGLQPLFGPSSASAGTGGLGSFGV
jgi:hypothetical protein